MVLTKLDLEENPEAAIARGEVNEAQFFDQNFQPIPGSNPTRYRTSLNDWADKTVETARARFGAGSLEARLTRRSWKLVGITV